MDEGSKEYPVMNIQYRMLNDEYSIGSSTLEENLFLNIKLEFLYKRKSRIGYSKFDILH